jgi:hypothetical protein
VGATLTALLYIPTVQMLEALLWVQPSLHCYIRLTESNFKFAPLCLYFSYHSSRKFTFVILVFVIPYSRKGLGTVQTIRC